MDEIDLLLGETEHVIARVPDSHTRAALRRLSDIVRLLAARPTPASEGAGEARVRPESFAFAQAWDRWLGWPSDVAETVSEKDRLGRMRAIFQAGWDARKADQEDEARRLLHRYLQLLRDRVNKDIEESIFEMIQVDSAARAADAARGER